MMWFQCEKTGDRLFQLVSSYSPLFESFENVSSFQQQLQAPSHEPLARYMQAQVHVASSSLVVALKRCTALATLLRKTLVPSLTMSDSYTRRTIAMLLSNLQS